MSNGNPDHKWNETLVVGAGQTGAWIEIPGWIKIIIWDAVTAAQPFLNKKATTLSILLKTEAASSFIILQKTT